MPFEGLKLVYQNERFDLAPSRLYSWVHSTALDEEELDEQSYKDQSGQHPVDPFA